jgi:uncharacterized membrane protein
MALAYLKADNIIEILFSSSIILQSYSIMKPQKALQLQKQTSSPGKQAAGRPALLKKNKKAEELSEEDLNQLEELSQFS